MVWNEIIILLLLNKNKDLKSRAYMSIKFTPVSNTKPKKQKLPVFRNSYMPLTFPTSSLCILNCPPSHRRLPHWIMLVLIIAMLLLIAHYIFLLLCNYTELCLFPNYKNGSILQEFFCNVYIYNIHSRWCM